MRLVFPNPHLERFGVNVAAWLIRRKTVNKYTYILDEIISNPDRPTAFVVDGMRSSFSVLGLPKVLISRPLALVEFYIWAAIHGINPFRHKVYRSVSELNPKEDVVFTFARVSTEREVEASRLEEYQGVVMVHFTHYFLDTKKIARRIQSLQHPVICAESDLTKNEYFQHHFPFVNSVYILPFVYADRFKSRVPFEQRHNKCFAIGTYFKSDSKDFLEFYGETPFHPMRHAIYHSGAVYQDYIDSYITEHSDNKSELRLIQSGDPLWLKIGKRVAPFFLLEKLSPGHHQKKYFSFDIVKKYNAYRMFVSPEEVVGLPSVNMVEGMACGSTYIGIDHPTYTDIGMKPGVHYIAYKEGSIDDLARVIAYYQQRPQELAQIAERGYKLTRSRFNPQVVATQFWNDAEQLLSRRLSETTVSL
ncbi:MAG: glycosyltransferase [Candidatus Andersenbacteria bacterium]